MFYVNIIQILFYFIKKVRLTLPQSQLLEIEEQRKMKHDNHFTSSFIYFLLRYFFANGSCVSPIQQVIGDKLTDEQIMFFYTRWHRTKANKKNSHSKNIEYVPGYTLISPK